MSAPPLHPGASLKTILIIDDEDTLRRALTRGLEIAGYRVLAAADADSGLELARAHLPDLILCDVNMPGKSGHRLLQEMRADPVLADRQFVLMTGNPEHARPRESMNLGADDFLLKPFTMAELLPCVQARLQRATVNRRVEDRVVNDLRTTLHSTLPHEFFTPLAGVLGLTNLLDADLATLDPTEVRAILHDIRRSCQRLHRTLRNYLFILDLETPGGPLPPGRLDAIQMEDAVRTGARTAAERHGRPPDLALILQPAPLVAGPTELTALVEEITDNAFAFSRPGTPVRMQGRPEGAVFRLTVTDSGRGMTPRQLQQLGAFQQPDRKRFEQQGLGLGLALVRKLVAHFGGDFRLESEPGRGTTAHVTLPLAAP